MNCFLPSAFCIMFFDSHCHLTAEQFDADRDAVIQRALDAGVTHLLTLATDVASSRAVIALAERYVNVYAAVGIHPESVRDATLDDLKIIRELAAHPKVVAIGEIGLDYYWDKTTAELQQTFFDRQLELAAELNLPVAIHDRDAHEAILKTLRRTCDAFPQTGETSGHVDETAWQTGGTSPQAGGTLRRTFPTVRNVRRNVPLRGVLHAFSGSIEMAQAAFELGFVISFGGPITFKNNRQAAPLLNALPLEKILIETDSPYLTPHPYRGKRNEPAHVKLVAEQIAQVKAKSIEQVATQTTSNARELFRLEYK